MKRKNVIDQLREAIEACPESENHIAKALDIDQANLNKFQAGERNISTDTFAKLCEYLGLHLASRRS